MQIVIDIDDSKLWEIKNEPIKKNFNIYELASYIDKGIPLPKGHGRLVDMKNLQNFVSRYTEHDAVQLILADREDYIPTIIKADKPKILYKDRWYNGLAN